MTPFNALVLLFALLSSIGNSLLLNFHPFLILISSICCLYLLCSFLVYFIFYKDFITVCIVHHFLLRPFQRPGYSPTLPEATLFTHHFTTLPLLLSNRIYVDLLFSQRSISALSSLHSLYLLSCLLLLFLSQESSPVLTLPFCKFMRNFINSFYWSIKFCTFSSKQTPFIPVL